MVNVDQTKCIGCGACQSKCPAVFKLNDRNKSEVIKQDNDECAKQAANECPTKAIAME